MRDAQRAPRRERGVTPPVNHYRMPGCRRRGASGALGDAGAAARVISDRAVNGTREQGAGARREQWGHTSVM
jgi:hypothetical protein